MEEEEDFDRDNVDFLPPIVVEEKTSDQRTGATGTEAVNSTYMYSYPFEQVTCIR